MATEKLLRKNELATRTGLDISTIYRRIKAGVFPAPIQIGRRSVAWRESDIAKWQESLVSGVRSIVSPRHRERA